MPSQRRYKVLKTIWLAERITIDIIMIQECRCVPQCKIGLSNHWRFRYFIKNGSVTLNIYDSPMDRDIDEWKQRIKNEGTDSL